ncbi:TPA: hypothetical protein HA241_00090 [Candidatus Woesearchaeota archaeon]|nr:hypothetical protein [Candidatus Woesearchaeota archaeon]
MTINVLFVDEIDRTESTREALQSNFPRVDHVAAYRGALDLLAREDSRYTVAVVNPTIPGQIFDQSAQLIRELRSRHISVIGADYGRRSELEACGFVGSQDIAQWTAIPYDDDKIVAQIRQLFPQ